MTKVSDLSEVFPEFINEELKRGFVSFGKKIKGFDTPDAVMTAVESRTSAPVRILRNESREAYDRRLIYPCGEGAGYAGGITSAAIDGIKTALEIMKKSPNFCLYELYPSIFIVLEIRTGKYFKYLLIDFRIHSLYCYGKNNTLCEK